MSEERRDAKQPAPACQFYWRDPMAHEGLQSLSLEHHGLWINLFMRMMGSSEYGVLLINGRAMTDEAIARAVREPLRKTRRLLDELLTAGVYARRDDGAIYSPRMMRDERLRRVRAEGGRNSVNHPTVAARMGGTKGAGKGSWKDTLPATLDPSPSTATASSSSSASSAAAPEDSSSQVDRFLSEFSQRREKSRGRAYTPRPGDREIVAEMLEQHQQEELLLAADVLFRIGPEVDQWIADSDCSIRVLRKRLEWILDRISNSGHAPKRTSAVPDAEETARKYLEPLRALRETPPTAPDMSELRAVVARARSTQ